MSDRNPSRQVATRGWDMKLRLVAAAPHSTFLVSCREAQSPRATAYALGEKSAGCPKRERKPRRNRLSMRDSDSTGQQMFARFDFVEPSQSRWPSRSPGKNAWLPGHASVDP